MPWQETSDFKEEKVCNPHSWKRAPSFQEMPARVLTTVNKRNQNPSGQSSPQLSCWECTFILNNFPVCRALQWWCICPGILSHEETKSPWRHRLDGLGLGSGPNQGLPSLPGNLAAPGIMSLPTPSNQQLVYILLSQIWSRVFCSVLIFTYSWMYLTFISEVTWDTFTWSPSGEPQQPGHLQSLQARSELHPPCAKEPR